MLKFQITVAEVVNSVDYESAVHLDLLAGNTYTYPNSFGCIFIHVWVSAITIINYNQSDPSKHRCYNKLNSDQIKMDPTLNLRNY